MDGRRVLLVEDDEIIREFLREGLEASGFRPTPVADGEAALAVLERDGSDLVLTDVRMPGIDGVGLCRRVKEAHPGLPVVLVTGVGGRGRERLLEASGADACLPKPLRIADLCRVLEAAMAARS